MCQFGLAFKFFLFDFIFRFRSVACLVRMSSVPLLVFESDGERSVAQQVAGIHNINNLDVIRQLLGIYNVFNIFVAKTI